MYNVVIVEDDPMVSMINGEYVNRNKNFNVAASFKNGSELIDYLKDNSCDLIFLDVYMPYMNGVETLKKIREMNVSSEVIMVTAANDAATIKETMHLGVIDYLIKPFAFERFQIALEKFTNKINTLKEGSVLDQKSIDSLLINHSNEDKNTSTKKYPKGIQEKTLNMILDFYKNNPTWQSGEIVASKLNLSSVTIRHYMTYLIENNFIEKSINYETGGRPSMLYKIIN